MSGTRTPAGQQHQQVGDANVTIAVEAGVHSVYVAVGRMQDVSGAGGQFHQLTRLRMLEN